MARTSKGSAEYWADRLSRQNQRIGDKTAEEIESRIRQYYRAASADITREAEGLYNKLVAEAGDQPVKPNDLYRLDRMYHLQTKIHNRLRELGSREIEVMDDRLRQLAEKVDQSTVSGLPDAARNSPWAVLPREEAEAIANRVRGVNPWPGAFCYYEGMMLKIWKATALTGGGGTPGKVLCADAHKGLVISTGEGSLRIDTLQMPGKKPMSAQDFLRGRAIAEGGFFREEPASC